jgi:D-threo-aldose 1-dehydrogenase
LGLGTAALGHLFKALADAEAEAVVHAAYAAGIRFFDTAHLYGGGLAETRLGRALARYPRSSYRLSTKLGVYRPYGQPATPPGSTQRRSADVWDFSPERTEAALATSLVRLHTDYVDIVHVHAFDNHFEAARSGAFATLTSYRDQGVVRAIGGGSDAVPPLQRAIREGLLDALLTAGRQTLIDRSAERELLPLAAQERVEVIVGGIFNSGILATGDVPDARFDYDPAPPAVREHVARLQTLCADRDVPLRAAALQFPLRSPEISIMLLGPASVEELEDCLSLLAVDIPEDFWRAVDDALGTPETAR